MKKMFAAVLLVSVAVACTSKKPAAAPAAQDKAPLERKEDATGGARYGGKDAAPPSKDTPNPSAPR
jgi:hypothetical protein